jgi:hypothetical protein
VRQQQCWATYSFVCGEKSNLTITSNSRKQNLSFQKMWGNNNLGLHTFVCGEKLDLTITSEFKEAKFVTSKDVGQKQCWVTYL